MTQEQTKAAEIQLQDIFSFFAVDKKKSIEGVEKKIGGTTFLIAKAGNAKFQAKFQVAAIKLMEQYPEDQRESTEYSDKLQEAYVNCLAEHVLVGWDTVLYRGKTYVYSVEMAKELLSHEEFANAVLQVASDRSLYTPTLSEEDAKN